MKAHAGKKSPYPEIVVTPRKHSGQVLPTPQRAALVVRNGMVIRRAGVPVDPPEPYNPEKEIR